MEPHSQGTILVADDEPFVLDSVSLLLGKYGYNVVPCRNAAEAIEKFSENNVDVVLTDIKMPVMSGIELLERINTANPDTPVILMTAFADITTAIDAIKKRAFDFIIKPYNVDQLLHSIEKAMKFNRLLKLEKDYKSLLEEFNRELENMVSERTMSLMALTVADRVRNPATTIGQICRRIMEKEPLSSGVRVSIENIAEETGKLEKIVCDFQNIFKSRQSHFTYEDINSIVKSSMLIVQKEADEKGVSLEASLSEKSLKINTQKNLLGLAVSQLIRNAIEATPERGRVEVTTAGNMEQVILTVSDTGQGIPPEHIDKIFNPFFSTRERRFGMGLALVRQIILEHLGDITVQSSAEKGSTFRMAFPVRWLDKSLVSK
ncbi:MAG: response regulator [Dissulfurispiraceae bacterium]|jgi:signal transduction histidine kinase